MMPEQVLMADIDFFIHDPYIVWQGDAFIVACFAIAWLGVFGAIFGSFLNVVIYRLPLGMSLSFPGSRCPVCKHAIRWYDNVPVLGWLWLGGRCRDCRTAISPRYPLVELFVGLLFAGLAWLEVFDLGINLPVRMPLGGLPPVSLWLQYAYHLALACTLLCAGLMEVDGQSTPARLWLPAMLVGLALPIVWPELRPVPLTQGVPVVFTESAGLAGIAEGLAGLAAGASLGWAASAKRLQSNGATPKKRSQPANDATPAAPPANAAIVLGLIGSFLGWQAVCWVVIGGGLLYGLAIALSNFGLARQIDFVGCASLATLMLLFTWRWLDLKQLQSGVPGWLAPGCVAALVAAGSRWVGRRSSSHSGGNGTIPQTPESHR